MRVIGADGLRSALSMTAAIDALETAFTHEDPSLASPMRTTMATAAGTLLTMPAAGDAGVGVKLVTLSEFNPQKGLPFVQATYVLFDVDTQRPEAVIDGTELTGHPVDRLPGLLSIIARDTDGSAVAVALDLEGIAASVGSACATGSTEVSHVLSAMGYPDDEARGSLRLSLGRTTTGEDVDRAIDVVPRVLESMRRGSVAVAADPLGQGQAQGRVPGVPA
jgi:cysteine sulfinate desulfinase/cysteine desulfurase-like protein